MEPTQDNCATWENEFGRKGLLRGWIRRWRCRIPNRSDTVSFITTELTGIAQAHLLGLHLHQLQATQTKAREASWGIVPRIKQFLIFRPAAIYPHIITEIRLLTQFYFFDVHFKVSLVLPGITRINKRLIHCPWSILYFQKFYFNHRNSILEFKLLQNYSTETSL